LKNRSTRGLFTLFSSFRVRRSQFSEYSARSFWLSSDFSGYTLFVRTIFSIICPFCQFWILLKVEIFQSTFGGEPIKNRWLAAYCGHFRREANSRPELISNVMENGNRLRQHQNCQAISIIRREKRSTRWRAMRAAERPLLRAADASMCWTGTGAAVFDRRGGSHGLGSRMASGRRRSMSRRSDIA
jgi:hypothetical protein